MFPFLVLILVLMLILMLSLIDDARMRAADGEALGRSSTILLRGPLCGAVE